MQLDRKYWDAVAHDIQEYYVPELLADYKSREYIRLVKKWTKTKKNLGDILLTDSFELTFRRDPLYEWLSDKGTNRVAVMDISFEILRLAKVKAESPGEKRLLCTECTITETPFEDRSFDLVVSPSTLDHVDEIDTAIDEIYRILRPGGVFILTLNTKHNPFFVLNTYLCPVWGKLEFDAGKCYSFKETEEMLKRAGFSVEATTAIMHVPFLFPSIAKLLERLNDRRVDKILQHIVRLFEEYGKKELAMKKFTGWWIALKAVK